MSFPAIGIGSGVLGFRPYWCPSPFPSPSIFGVFHSLLTAIGFQWCFFFTADVSPPIHTHSVPYYISASSSFLFRQVFAEIEVFTIICLPPRSVPDSIQGRSQVHIVCCKVL